MTKSLKKKNAVLATHNLHKVREIRKILGKAPLRLLGLDKVARPYKVRETGKTLEENALLKARLAHKRTKMICLADDTGLEIKALNGEPGVRSARYAGYGCDFNDNNRKVLRLLKGVPLSKRTAVFRCVVAVMLEDGSSRLFEGRCPGRIVLERRGSGGFGYDPVFQPRGYKKVFAEMSLTKKNQISHRSKAFGKAAAYLAHYLKNKT